MKPYLIPLITAGLLATGAPSMALEEPEFEVIRATDRYEIRRYEPFIVAEVDVEGDAKSAGNRAFRILAGYIFGDNASGEKMEMTAPVVSDPPRGERQSHTYAFVMESRYSLDTLPPPVDKRIRIVQVPGRVMAAKTYTGRWTGDNYLRNELSLTSALAIDGIRTRSEPFLARYDSPFKPWFMRRNEVLIELDWD